ncbi:PD40 domain-containing protein [Bacillus sp. FJAT-49736]|uniref:TolB family protein n=1 Tax=Bacillus sp. FJAT-49736 TaxID=2833582 RepID=UPI001BC92A33|nr:PD40 domain-containing protein [Bacillus sp. FJAT-49736]MBS4175133.1 PD40 domain-containing protein [Bacillus sp. FJAT-49736]
MTYTSKMDILSEYIDALNDPNLKVSQDLEKEELLDLIETVDHIKLLHEVEMPSNEYVESVALKIRSIEQPKSLRKKVGSRWGFTRWFPLAASILLIAGLSWQQFANIFVSADEITVVQEKELIPLGPNEIENPSYLGENSLISFGNNEKIWIWNPQTDKMESLPLGDFLYMRNPAWSPDHSKVAFSGYKNGSAGIWTMNIDGSNIKKVSAPSSIDENHDTPVWSPDGKQLAFTKTVTEAMPTHGFTITKQEIWIIHSDGSHGKKLVNGKEPSWSPDGKMLSFTKVSKKQSNEIWTIQANGTQAKKLTNGMESSWSPNGQFIVYSKYRKTTEEISKLAAIQTSLREIWAIHVKTHKLSQLTKGKVDEKQQAQWRQEAKEKPPTMPIQYVSSGLYSDWQPSWASDGKSILFSRDKQQETGNHFSLYKINVKYN